jgi:hypothetical protein
MKQENQHSSGSRSSRPAPLEEVRVLGVTRLDDNKRDDMNNARPDTQILLLLQDERGRSRRVTEG